ncbi:MAG TPA: HD domain-containing protein [Chthoniobacterales bacterium]|nr:HD domain-containing protein [Chthoniobacterales bacterium]
MKIVDRIDEAISQDPESAVLAFGPYRIVKRLGKGEQGGVYQLMHPIGKSFALKLYLPGPDVTMSETESIGNFVREVKILATTNHKNIVGIKTAGRATYNDIEARWQLVEGLDSEDGGVYFYVMDYLSRRLSDMFPACRRDYDPETELPIYPQFEPLRVDLFEKVVRHISDAIIHCHREKLAHKDIKADNILFRDEDQNFVLADFGFARHGTSPGQDPVIRRFENVNPTLILEEKYEANDIFEFALVLRKILPLLRNDYDATRYSGLEDTLLAATSFGHRRFPTRDAMFFKRTLEQYFTRSGWGLRLRTGDFLLPRQRNRFVFDSRVQLPVSGPVSLTPEVKAVIDEGDFQRLRGTRQLGPTFFVFPGAYHTRFEHSLGTYHLALRYLESLTRLPIFNDFADPVPEMLKLVTLSALLHDIGHYPYSHWIEELAPLPQNLNLPSHEQRAKQILERSKIKTIISERWDLDPNLVTDVICGENLTDPRKLVAHSIIDSVLDVDKLDYLIRDSIHCGVTYGRALDPDRLIDALYLDIAHARICLNRKGRSYLPSLLACRNVMYQEVYWHKTVRACTGMFKHFFYHYVKRDVDNPTVISELLELPDDVFISTLVQRVKATKHTDLLPLISPFAFAGRDIFKPAYTFSLSSKNEPLAVSTFFQRLLDQKDYQGSVDASKRIAESLKTRCPGITELDLIVEKTPVKPGKETYSYRQLRIWDSRKNDFDDVPEKLGASNDYLESVRQAYIFCHPKYYSTLKAMTPDDWGPLLEEVGRSK